MSYSLLRWHANIISVTYSVTLVSHSITQMSSNVTPMNFSCNAPKCSWSERKCHSNDIRNYLTWMIFSIAFQSPIFNIIKITSSVTQQDQIGFYRYQMLSGRKLTFRGIHVTSNGVFATSKCLMSLWWYSALFWYIPISL